MVALINHLLTYLLTYMQNVAGTTHIKGLQGSVYMEMLNALCRYHLRIAAWLF